MRDMLRRRLLIFPVIHAVRMLVCAVVLACVRRRLGVRAAVRAGRRRSIRASMLPGLETMFLRASLVRWQIH
jgi:hypothetical protein